MPLFHIHWYSIRVFLTHVHIPFAVRRHFASDSPRDTWNIFRLDCHFSSQCPFAVWGPFMKMMMLSFSLLRTVNRMMKQMVPVVHQPLGRRQIVSPRQIVSRRQLVRDRQLVIHRQPVINHRASTLWWSVHHAGVQWETAPVPQVCSSCHQEPRSPQKWRVLCGTW